MIRSSGDETVTCLFNLGDVPANIPEEVPLDGALLACSDEDIDFTGRILPPYGFAILGN